MSDYLEKSKQAGRGYDEITPLNIYTYKELATKILNSPPKVFHKTGFNGLDGLIKGFEAGRLYVLSAPTKQGKCFGKGTEVLMYSGISKKIEDIQIGDRLMGNDSKPRTVKQLGRGKEQMYKITLRNGDSFTCNESHILTLRETGKGRIVNIAVKDYLTKSKNFKHLHKMYKTGVEFRLKDLLVDPYFVGLWLGDGTTENVGITTADEEIRDYLYSYAKKLNWDIREVRQENNKAIIYHIKKLTRAGSSQANCLIKMMRKIGLIGSKFIPDDYKINTRENRLKLLAGLIDSDGYKNKHGIIFCNKNKKLCEDVIFVCRSLGLSASLSPFLNGVYNQTYYKVHISGNAYEIPLLLKRKYPEKTKKVKNVSNLSFTIEPTRKDNYYGVVLGDNHLFLLADFTVVHNTTLAQTIMFNMALEGNASMIFEYEMGWEETVGKFMEMDNLVEGKSPSDLCMMMPMELHRGGGQLQYLWIYEAIEKSVRENGIKLVVIDHLHFLLPLQETKNTSFVIGGIVREIKRIAVALKIPIILIAHIGMIKDEKVPDWSDIRDSSFITQEADVTLMMYRAKNKNAAKKITDDTVEDIYRKKAFLSVELNRGGGKTGKLALWHDGTKFIPYTDQHKQEESLAGFIELASKVDFAKPKQIPL